MNDELDTGKTIRQITRLFAEIKELREEIDSLREIVERLQIKLETTNDEERMVYTDTK